jgi:HSP20 family protein
MANVMRYDPFDLLEGVMKSVLRPGYEAAQSRPTGGSWGAPIPIDAAEDERCYYITADLPGVRKEDVNVSIKGNQVSLSAEIKREKAVEQGQGKETVLCAERPTGMLSRSVQFAAEIDDSKAEAQYRDGVLTLKLPKKESAQVKRLSIH